MPALPLSSFNVSWRNALKSDELINTAGSYDIAGCCGARIAPDITAFNSTWLPRFGGIAETITDVTKTYNRGVLFGLNLSAEEIEHIPGTKVDTIKLGDDTLHIRLKLNHLNEE